MAYNFGSPGWTPVVGDWNNNGIKKTEVTNGQQWYLDTTGNGAWDAGSDMAYNFGSPVDTVSRKLERDANGRRFGASITMDPGILDNDGSGYWNAGDRANTFGAVGWTPVTGDWNSDVTSTKIGVYKDGTRYLAGTETAHGIPVRINHTCSEQLAWVPVTGNWS